MSHYIIRDFTKISSCWVNTTSRRGIKQTGIAFGFIFHYFPTKVARDRVVVARGNLHSPALNDSFANADKTTVFSLSQ